MVLSHIGCPDSGLLCRLAISCCRNPSVGHSGGITSEALIVCILVGGIMTMLWLSPSPWSVLGGWERVLAMMLVLPSMCLILKLYSCRSACQFAVLRLRLAWSVRMVNGSFVQPR